MKSFFKRNIKQMTDPVHATEEEHKSALNTAVIVISCIVALAVVVWVARVLIFEPGSDGTQQPAAQPTQQEQQAGPAPTDGADAGNDGSACLDSAPADVSNEPPKTKSWVAEGLGVVPQVPGAGPCRELRSGLQVGFAHTMTGALTAAQWYSATIAVTLPDDSSVENFKAVMVDGPNRSGIIAKTKSILSGERKRGDSTISRALELVGYKVLSYSDNEANIQLAYEFTAPDSPKILAAVQMRLRWTGGDWTIVPVSTDDWSTGQKLASLQGFTRWGPRGGDE